jgi:hypothetical protein
MFGSGEIMASFCITGHYILIIDAVNLEQAQNFFEAQNYNFLDVELDEDYEIEPCDIGEY